MHTMFTKHHRSSNASARAEAEAAASIAASMASNCTNELSNIIQNNNLPSLAASLASNPISQYYDIVGKPGGSCGNWLFSTSSFLDEDVNLIIYETLDIVS